MQDLEKNTDDLFRKAVENYRVNPGESNWDKIVPQLSEAAPPASKLNRKKYSSILLLLILLLLTGGGLIKYISYDNFKSVQNNKPVDSYKEQSYNNKNPINKKSTIPKDLPAQQLKQSENNLVLAKKIKQEPFKIGDASTSENNLSIASSKELKIVSIAVERDNVNNSSTANQSALISPQLLNDALQIATITAQKNNDSSIVSSGKSSTKVSPFEKQHHVYIGFLGGLSLNKVKDQQLRKPGFDIGVTAGYQFSDRMALETGIFLSRKHYFTEGKYFSMEKISASMPPEMKVMSIDGNSTIFEIPLKLKFDVCDKNKRTFFSSAGLSSYILTKEKNDYHTLMNGTNKTVTSLYKNSSSYFAGALNVSLGYEHTIGNHNNKIRIEPYVQIPLKGIGMGALPVMSSGLHIGFTLSSH
jgi:hypothetical protein